MRKAKATAINGLPPPLRGWADGKPAVTDLPGLSLRNGFPYNETFCVLNFNSLIVPTKAFVILGDASLLLEIDIDRPLLPILLFLFAIQ